MITEPKKRDVALVVDDSPETLRLLTDSLDGAGMTVMVALDGASAMRIIDQITPDIILLDAVMPAAAAHHGDEEENEKQKHRHEQIDARRGAHARPDLVVGEGDGADAGQDLAGASDDDEEVGLDLLLVLEGDGRDGGRMVSDRAWG